MRTILVTGVTGFIGSRLLPIIRKKYDGERIVALTSRPVSNVEYVLHKGYTFTKDDFIENGIDRIDILIHLGGYVAKDPKDRDQPAEQFMQVVNTKRLLSNLPSIPKKIIYCSSSAVYKDHRTQNEKSEIILLDENTFPDPQDYYGIAKYSCELLVKDYALNNACNFIILRLSPIYGPGDKRTNALIMKLISNAANGIDLSVWIDPNTCRNYLYVDDCCKFIANSLDLERNEIINVCSSHNTSIKELIDAVLLASNNKVKCVYADLCKHENGVLLDHKKREKYLGEEDFSIKKGIAETFRSVVDNE